MRRYHKKNKLYVLDGIINYPIDVKNFRCCCRARIDICPHLQFILSTGGIDYDDIKDYLSEPHIWELCKSRLATMSSQELNVTINKFMHDTECPICLDKLGRRELWQCPDCHNYTHGKCMLKWQKSCPNCRSEL